ncbi:MAG: hypothetical protein ABEJ83_02490 [Candidatus Nanohaloarchaea archaeon]
MRKISLFLILTLIAASSTAAFSLNLSDDSPETVHSSSGLQVSENSSRAVLHWSFQRKSFKYLKTRLEKSENSLVQITLLQSWREPPKNRIFSARLTNGSKTYNISEKKFDTVQITLEKNGSVSPTVKEIKFLSKKPGTVSKPEKTGENTENGDKGLLAALISFLASLIP